MIQTFFNTFWRSLTDPAVYRQLSQRRFKQGLAYFLTWYALFSATAALFITLFILPDSIVIADKLLQATQEGFPQQASVRVSQGSLTLSNVAAPFSIPLPVDFGNNMEQIVVIDPSASAEEILDRKSLFMLTEEAFSIPNAVMEQGFQVFRWDQVGNDFELNYEVLSAEIESIRKDIEQLQPWAFPILLLLLFVVLGISRFISVLFNSVFINLIMIILGRGQSYTRSVVLGLHTMILAECINLIQIVAYAGAFPNLITYAFLGISIIAVLALPKIRPQAR